MDRRLRLDDLPRHRLATIASVDWVTLGEREGRRLRELGVDEGVTVESLHRAPFGADPITCRIGRMTVAMRRATASAIVAELLADEPEQIAAE